MYGDEGSQLSHQVYLDQERQMSHQMHRVEAGGPQSVSFQRREVGQKVCRVHGSRWSTSASCFRDVDGPNSVVFKGCRRATKCVVFKVGRWATSSSCFREATGPLSVLCSLSVCYMKSITVCMFFIGFIC